MIFHISPYHHMSTAIQVPTSVFSQTQKQKFLSAYKCHLIPSIHYQKFVESFCGCKWPVQILIRLDICTVHKCPMVGFSVAWLVCFGNLRGTPTGGIKRRIEKIYSFIMYLPYSFHSASCLDLQGRSSRPRCSYLPLLGTRWSDVHVHNWGSVYVLFSLETVGEC